MMGFQLSLCFIEDKSERCEKGGLQGRTSPYPLSRSVPPGRMTFVSTQVSSLINDNK